MKCAVGRNLDVTKIYIQDIYNLVFVNDDRQSKVCMFNVKNLHCDRWRAKRE